MNCVIIKLLQCHRLVDASSEIKSILNFPLSIARANLTWIIFCKSFLFTSSFNEIPIGGCKWPFLYGRVFPPSGKMRTDNFDTSFSLSLLCKTVPLIKCNLNAFKWSNTHSNKKKLLFNVLQYIIDPSDRFLRKLITMSNSTVLSTHNLKTDNQIIQHGTQSLVLLIHTLIVHFCILAFSFCYRLP